MTSINVGDFDFYDNLLAKLYDKHIIHLWGEIDEPGVAFTCSKIQALSLTSKDIHLLISSYGGKLEPGGAVIRTIRDAQSQGCNIIGEVIGYAQSMAAIILQACDTRFASPEDIIMVHGITSSSSGDIRSQEAEVSMTKKMMDIHAELLANRNTSLNSQYHDVKFWRDLLNENDPHYYIGKEALDVGLVDEII